MLIKFKESNLGTVRWMRFVPCLLAFYTEVMPDQYHPTSHLNSLNEEPLTMHSVLEITTTSGEEIIFDGTPEQFGWSNTACMLNKRNVELYFVEAQMGMWEVDDADKETLKSVILETDPQPWDKLYKQMEELLEELDWDTLKGLEDEESWKRVLNQAQRKFATSES